MLYAFAYTIFMCKHLKHQLMHMKMFTPIHTNAIVEIYNRSYYHANRPLQYVY